MGAVEDGRPTEELSCVRTGLLIDGGDRGRPRFRSMVTQLLRFLVLVT
jgi:hypothetical protein